MTDLDDLQHYGVKGMRWGVRRSQAELDRAAGRTPRKSRKEKRADKKAASSSSDAQAASAALKKAKKNGVQSLSNQELQTLNARLNLEQNYSRLTSPQKGGKKQQSPGSKFVQQQVTNLAQKQVQEFIKDGGVQKTMEFGARVMAPMDFSDIKI